MPSIAKQREDAEREQREAAERNLPARRAIAKQREDAERALVARRFISPTELAFQLGVSPASTLRACREGRVRCTRFGKRFLIPADEADRILENSSGMFVPAA